MDTNELLKSLLQATNTVEVEKALVSYNFNNATTWVPVGDRPNNSGTIQMSADQGRSLVERVTNGIDAILELEHDTHNGRPECKTPKEAARSWLNIPDEGLSGMTAAERRTIARDLTVSMAEGNGKDKAVIEVRDLGIGMTPDLMPKTILSLNEGNKILKHYLCGVYGQGGSSTLAISKYTIIASKVAGSDVVGFTVVKYLNLPAETYKIGQYVYLVSANKVLQAIDPNFKPGTLVKHIDYELSQYYQPVGPHSVYGLLNRVLFDPVIPIWLDDRLHNYRRVIKGSRNALNGAVDEEDEDKKGPTLSHSMKMFYVKLADFGQIGIEYWVLASTKKNKKPTAAFVSPVRTIILTINGQNHAELSKTIVKNELQLPYLASRLIVHIDCNNLTPEGKRQLFVSNREDVRQGVVQELVQQEIIKALKSDDQLTKLNEDAMHHSLSERNEDEKQSMRQEVARILKLQGVKVIDDLTEILAVSGKVEGGSSKAKGMTHHQAQPIQLNEPPTYIKILWNNIPVPFYARQRRYIRIETDANSNYHTPNNPAASKINIIADGGLKVCGSTPLKDGRMRAVIECDANTTIGTKGKIRIELSRPEASMLFDEKPTEVVEKPQALPERQGLTLPDFEIQGITPDGEAWTDLEWSDDVTTVASAAVHQDNKLIIYYSKVFPQYENKVKAFASRKASLDETFTKKYELWLIVHSLLYENDKKDTVPNEDSKQEGKTDEEEAREDYERKERCRLAIIASLIAAKETEQAQEMEVSNE